MACMRRKESVSAAAYTYTVLLQPEPEGGYTVTCPALPGLVTYGASLDEARAMAADAIRGYIECLREDGEPIPESDPAPVPLVDRVSVTAVR
jgi:antitoxin HicB